MTGKLMQKKERDSERRKYEGYIGIFDSGVGGISVLKEMHRMLPSENFLYYGDSANAPYGDKPDERISELAENVTKHLMDSGVKAVVIACNTATSAAAAILRERYPAFPIIGIEPALKPAATAQTGKRLLVMATDATLRLDKFRLLESQLKDRAEFMELACPGLADLLEKGDPASPAVKAYLEELLHDYKGKVDGVVLGCTHYPFVKPQIRDVLGDVKFYDGAGGTARELKRQLENRGLLRPGEEGKIVFESSRDTKEELLLYQKYFQTEIA